MNENYEDTIVLTLKNLLEPLYSALPKGKTVTDVLINPDGCTYVDCSSGENLRIGHTLSNDEIVRIGTLLASLSGRMLSAEHPEISTTFENGRARFEILIPPIVKSASLSLRLHNSVPFSIDDLISNGMLTKTEASFLTEKLALRKNIVISGETGSGKTTLLSSLLNTIDKNERIIIVEEGTEEVNCSLPNQVRIIMSNRLFSGRDALESALRMNPDRIIFGEARDGASMLETLKAWRTGHSGGLMTLHATSASSIKARIGDLLSEVCTNPQQGLIDDTVDVMVHCSLKKGKRKVEEIIG